MEIKATSRNMRGIWLDKIPQFREDLPIPTPSIGEALVRVRMAGICGTDLALIKGYHKFSGILGHEFVGHIDLAPDDPFREGERVVGEINSACGKCKSCQRGYPTHCEQRRVLGIKNLNGAFADYLCLPLENLHLVPETISDESAVFSEPLAAALQIFEQTNLNPTSRVLVIGGGRLGQLIAQVVSLNGCDCQVVARYPRQRELLKLSHIPTIDENRVPNKTFDIVIEATGSPEGVECALRTIRPRGVIVLKSTYEGNVNFNFSSLVVDEVTLIGSRCGPFLPALSLLEKKFINPLPLIDKRFPMDDGLDALKWAAKPGILKILIQINPLDSGKNAANIQ